MNSTEKKIQPDQVKKTRRKKKKTLSTGYENSKRLVIDSARSPQTHALAVKLLSAANHKEHGRPVTFERLIALALSKIAPADLDRLKSESLSPMDRVNLKLIEHNRRHKTNLSLGEFLVQELNINQPQQEEK